MEENEQIYRSINKLSESLQSHMQASAQNATEVKLSLQQIQLYQKADKKMLLDHDDQLKEWKEIKSFWKGASFVLGVAWLSITGFISWFFSRH